MTATRVRPGRPTVLTIGVALLGLFALGCGSESDSDTEPERDARSSDDSPGRGDRGQLLGRLRSGGLVVMFRHAATNRADEDDPDVDLDDCSTQRNLTDEGRDDARNIGAAFRELRIPVGAVWASPYCRARDTAELAFGRHRVVDGLERLFPERDEAADRRMNRLISERAPGRSDPNLVIAAHGIYPSVLDPPVTIEEGEAAVYEVRGTNARLLGRVAPDEWARLGSRAAPARGAGELSEVVDRVQRSVVSIESRQGVPAGAGFRVAVEGIVVTSARVVGDAREVTVVLHDGTRRPARVLGRAPDVEVAVLELEDDSGLPPMHSGSGLAEARVGDPVLAVGSGPAGGVTAATIDALRVPARVGRTGELEALAIDAHIEPAQSGAPLVNRRGEVLGVVTAAARPHAGDPAGTGLAVPVEVARRASLEIVQRRG